MILTVAFAGCHTISGSELGADATQSFERAKASLAEGQFYRAKKLTQEVLEADPQNTEAQDMMGKILGLELERHKTITEENVPEDWSDKDKHFEAQTWLDRSRTYLAIKQYDQALVAAENVFLSDPDNKEASGLVDEIHREALKDGKRESLIYGGIKNSEMQARIVQYRRRAQDQIQKGRIGQATLLVKKLLLLSPEDPVGLQLQKELKVNEDTTYAI